MLYLPVDRSPLIDARRACHHFGIDLARRMYVGQACSRPVASVGVRGPWPTVHVTTTVCEPPFCAVENETAVSSGIIPSFLAYSSFDTSNRNLYAVMVVLTTTVQVVSATVKWIREDKVRRERPYSRDTLTPDGMLCACILLGKGGHDG